MSEQSNPALTEDAPTRDDDEQTIVCNVLCRVFDDGADAGMEEWRAWYEPGKWFGFDRALGAFIWERLQRAGPSRPHPQAWYEERHARLTQRITNYRRGIRQLQQSHERWRRIAGDALAARRAALEREDALRKRLEVSRASEAKSWFWIAWTLAVMFAGTIGVTVGLVAFVKFLAPHA